jgi:OmpA-OmpF porin, OOP family
MTIQTVSAFGLALGLALATAGCASKNYVHGQLAPLVERTDQLNEKTASNARQIRDVDGRAQSGVTQAQTAAEGAQQKAQGAALSASEAEAAANNAVHRADSLAEVVKNLDLYKPVADTTVTFAFDKAVLSKEDEQQLDQFAAQLGGAQEYILEVTGGTDSTGSAEYNYALSQRRADAVVQYLAAKHNVAPHRFYLIGIGKDKQAASNKTAEGRKLNRRVEVRLLTAASAKTQATASASGGKTAPKNLMARRRSESYRSRPIAC